MIDNKENLIANFADFNFDACSQFKEFNYEHEMTDIQKRMYYLMLNGSRPRGSNESLYGWTTSLGLSRSTAFGFFSKNNKTMHSAVAEKIANATGAYPLWIQNGVGVPFPQAAQQNRAEQVKGAFTDKIQSMPLLDIAPLQPNEINKELLEQCFDLTDGVLEATFNSMRADDMSDFIIKLYKTRLEEVNQEFNLNEENFMLAIFTIEVALVYTRHTMSPKSKAQLIPEIYEKYDSNTAMKQATIKQLEKYRGEHT
ncbi:hypothetical protein [Acinetobacter defluvii]|uniref:hypothetical protein n=1 Tax=Acinetobacter defluvii TaxID=1871111 RepID=UPI003AF8D481